MNRLKIFIRYAFFGLIFAICFAVMFVFLLAAVMGITAGALLAVLGIAMIMFKADFIVTALAPEIMLFGGLTGMFFSAFLGLCAIKLGYMVSRLFVRTRRRCERLRSG